MCFQSFPRCAARASSMPEGWEWRIRNALCFQESFSGRAVAGTGSTGGVPWWKRQRHDSLGGACVHGWKCETFVRPRAMNLAFLLSSLLSTGCSGLMILLCPAVQGETAVSSGGGIAFPRGEQHRQSSVRTRVWSASTLGSTNKQTFTYPSTNLYNYWFNTLLCTTQDLFG